MSCTREQLSVSGGLIHTGRLVVQMREQAYRGPDVVRFLQQRLRQIAGKRLVLWDGAPIHRAQPVKDFRVQGAAARLQLEPLPGYAPEDLNPEEGVWHYLKHVDRRNLCCAELAALRLELGLAVQRLRHKAHVLHGCIAEWGYALLVEPPGEPLVLGTLCAGLTAERDAA